LLTCQSGCSACLLPPDEIFPARQTRLMPVTTSAELLRLLKKSQLLSQQQLELVRSRASTMSPQELASSLADEGLLTAWQSNQLLKGQTGFVLGRYRLLNPVGRGGMGHVFRARDDRDGQIVAIKVMARKLSRNEVLVNRFRREIKASSRLKSPHIVRAVDAGRVGNVDFMVMEYVNGDQLDRIANRVGTLPTGLACEIIHQAAVGLQHACEQGIVHRDIKPSNLIVDWNSDGIGTVKIMDLGLVRLESEQPENNSVTRTGQVMGTPDYMSPEQAWDTTKADIRSDIYSLGCALFRLLTGQVPFPGDNPLQILMARCSRDVPDIGSVRGDIPDALRDVVAKMTRRDPAARYQTPGEVAHALEPMRKPLTQQALRKAIRAAAGSGGKADNWTGAAGENSGNDDAPYEQFLHEMEAGAAVNLLMTTQTDEATDTPADEHFSPLVSEPRTFARRPQEPRRQKTPSKWLTIGGGVAIALIALIWWRLSHPGEQQQHDQQETVTQVAWVPPVVTLVPPEPVTVQAGESASVRVLYTISRKGSGGTLQPSLSNEAPGGVEFDAEHAVVTWQPTRLVTPGRYRFHVDLTWQSPTQAEQVGSIPVEFIVQPGPLSLALQEPEPVRLQVDQELQVTVASPGFDADEIGAAFRIASGDTAGLSLNSRTGELTWRPTVDAIGRHNVRVELYAVDSQKILAGTNVRILVAPSMLSLQLPQFSPQQLAAGERFQMTLPSRQPIMLRRAVRLKLGPGAPPGVVLDQANRTITWDVPADAAGQYNIPLLAEAISEDIAFTPDSRLAADIPLTVIAAAKVSAEPDAKSVADAERELRTVFRRDLSSARSVSARAQLAAMLLERSYDQTDDAADFALLNLVADLADRGNALDILFEAERIRAFRYGTDQVPRVLPALERLRRNDLSPVQQDLVVEHCLRLAAEAARQRDFAIVQKLVEPASLLLRTASDVAGGRRLTTDVAQAADLAEALINDGTDVVRGDELRRLLETWQFVNLFEQPDTLSFIQNSNAATPLVDSGRSLWTFGQQRLLMECPPRDGLTGFIETTLKPQRFVIRMHIAPRSNSLALIVGGVSGGELSGALVTLDSTGFGRIQQLPGPTPVRDPPQSVPLSTSLPNVVDVVGEGRQLTLRVNGTQVMSARLSEPVAGQIGIMSSLIRPEPGARVDVRRPRLLVIPDRQ
jgi:serine/threonine protein kinase